MRLKLLVSISMTILILAGSAMIAIRAYVLPRTENPRWNGLKAILRIPDPMSFGMRALPPDGSSHLDGIVDRYGLYAYADWPGKVTSDSQLKEQQLASPASTGLDKYGGWLCGPALEQTGYFRTQKVNGKWWLVTPLGHLFFSVGFNETSHDDSTFTSGRERFFKWLPNPDDPLYNHYSTQSAFRGSIKSGQAFNFYAANLQRKFGLTWNRKWQVETISRLKSWGFNTLGNWSDPALIASHKMPYVVALSTNGNYNHIPSGDNWWGQMPDPFDPGFALALNASLSSSKVLKHDPWQIGYFVDNEMSWSGDGSNGDISLALGTLRQNSAISPAKRELIRMLTQKYGSVDKLNHAWETSFADWNILSQPVDNSHIITAERMDLAAFVAYYAHKYFYTVNQIIKANDPNHLYLGCRFDRKPPESVLIASKACDVVSFNCYEKSLSENYGAIAATLNKPCMVGEFHFGASDGRVFWPGLNSSPLQSIRAADYKRYVESVEDNPAFVGCHWFQYTDEPLTGRTWDGENGEIGFVDVTDTPYRDLVNAAESVNQNMYTRRYEQKR